MKHVTIPIKGMHCPSCTQLLGEVLCDLPGVKDAKVDLASEKAHVTFDPAEVSEAQMRSAIEAEGYKVG
jgi:P-type Cu+ transporter